MTSEEFHGHLMALLAGPKGQEVASHMLRIALITDARLVGEAMGEIAIEALKGIHEMVNDLAIHAHLSGYKTEDPKTLLTIIGQREAALNRIRERLRVSLSEHEAGRKVIEILRLG